MTDSVEILKIREKLEEHEKRITYLEKFFAEPKKSESIRTEKSSIPISKWAEKLSISKDRIEELFDIENDSLTLVKVSGKDDKEKTKNVTLLALLGYKYLLGKNDILSQELRRNVAENRIPVNNFATYINDITPSLIRRKGVARSPKTTYKLQSLGEAEAKQLLKEVIEA
jgi:predicted RNase H-like nuclease (RuvC/YqgF family)